MKEIVINDVCFGSEPLGLILGPCVIESRDHSLMMAESIHCLLYTSPSPRDTNPSRMPSSA